ncbi:MAG: peptidase M16 [Bacteroidetes bacterium HGW-Bacteroidetes-2]|jgi:predicted Zn-dependent peptidase|nr:MAG: peptidase M16 [Bacteroidetes bacterium HGW-Bacteroidetes-2]
MKKYIISLFLCLFFATIITAQIDRSKRPIPGPAPTINLSEPQTFNLDNGLKVMVVKNTKLPRVRIQLLIDNPLYASGDKVGVESLLASMLGNGTTSISKDAFNEEIDFLGASVNFGSQGAFASSLSKYFSRVFELMADAAINPLLTEEEFQKEKDKLLESLKNNKTDVSTVSRQVSTALLYGKTHPKGEFVTEESVRKITFQDVKNYYDNFFSPANAYLIVIGDASTSEVQSLANLHFSKWPKKTVPKVNYSAPKDAQFTQINFIDMPNAVQSEIVVENVVHLKMSDPDYHAVLIANRILGGDFNSLLNMNLREANGYTYGARSSTGAGKDVTRFNATTSVRNAVTDSSVVEMLKEIRFIRDHKVTTEQLHNAKAKYTGDFVLALERPETVANYALNIETQKLPKDFYQNYLRKINAVTQADVERVSKKYYLVDNLRIVVTGKGSEVLNGLKNIKNANGKLIPVFYFDIYGNPTDEPNYTFEIDASITAETVLNDYINAIGGKSKLEGVNTLFTSANAEMQGMQLGMEMKSTKSNKNSLAILMGGMAMQKTIFDGQNGYSMAQGQKIDFTADQIESSKNSAVPFPELTSKGATLKGVENINGVNAYVIALTKNSFGYYDMETGLKLKNETIQDINGTEIRTAINYGEYKEVGGIKFPHTIAVAAGPQELKFEVAEIKINEGVSDEDFN